MHEMDMAYHEEIHSVLPRQDSITLAKRRLSHDSPNVSDEAALSWEGELEQASQHLVRWGGAVAVA